MAPVGENPENKLLCLHEFPSLPAKLEFRRALKADPLWAPLDTSSQSPDVLVEKVELLGFTATDFSPEFAPEKALKPRVFVAGGSLTEKKGVVSEFFTATEYSPLR